VTRPGCWIVATAAVATIAAVVGSCSDDPHQVVCGDGKSEPPEQCDDGNTNELDGCRLCVAYVPPKNVVKWDFNAMAAPGFTSDGCVDVGASTVTVALSGPSTASKDASCSLRQVNFDELPAGTYTASVTPKDSGGASLVTAPATATLAGNVTPGTTVETLVNVTPNLWARPMTGTFYFVLHWAGMTCATAAPPVTTQIVTLSIAGAPVTLSTSAATGLPSYRVDGTQPVTCVASTSARAEAIDLPFGAARIAVVGKDVGGAEMFRGTFDTFVGAGRSNPPLVFDVASTLDAGVDATPDAPTDAGVDATPDAPTDAAPDA
jgi:cysteine-rich repeat protein